VKKKSKPWKAYKISQTVKIRKIFFALRKILHYRGWVSTLKNPFKQAKANLLNSRSRNHMITLRSLCARRQDAKRKLSKRQILLLIVSRFTLTPSQIQVWWNYLRIPLLQTNRILTKLGWVLAMWSILTLSKNLCPW
jgi:hypothetical protein